MSLKEYVAHELGTLGENELKQVAEYVAFLKFRSRTSAAEAHLASLYSEFAQEDQELAEAGMNDYSQALSQEDAQ
ncbi:MAG: hypothetical protein JO316_11095 [Abitibacteriaceae bacterium]|nr:hypothetical protein [Abditibacteriaceae bacterium]MBV9865891.1 hypothetical protein [Abditibacteriaceae bacterium]